MGNATQVAVKEPQETKVTVKPVETCPETSKSYGKVQLFNRLDKKSLQKCYRWHKILFTVFANLVIIVSLLLIIMVVTSAVANRVINAGQSGRVAAAVLLAFTSAVSISISIYGIIGILANHRKPLYAAALIIILMATTQAVIAGAAVNMTEHEEESLSKSLLETFAASKAAKSRQHILWSSVEYNLKCCGLNNAEDYWNGMNNFFPPNIPISCCPNYDSGRSELVQERERESCKARRDYYKEGCRELILDGVKNAAEIIMSITIGLIVLEIITTMLSIILCSQLRSLERLSEKSDEET